MDWNDNGGHSIDRGRRGQRSDTLMSQQGGRFAGNEEFHGRWSAAAATTAAAVWWSPEQGMYDEGVLHSQAIANELDHWYGSLGSCQGAFNHPSWQLSMPLHSSLTLAHTHNLIVEILVY